jgi:hypothetical protein
MLDKAIKFPCTGLITHTDEGYLIAPALRLDIPDGRDIVLMMFSPRTRPLSISLDKTSLSIMGETASVTLSTGTDGLQCTGTVPSGEFIARIILTRNPGLPVYTQGFEEKLCETKESEASISATWKPVTRSFEDSVIAFHPSKMNMFSLDKVSELLGAPEDDDSFPGSDFVVGDGGPVNYSVRLVIDRHLGRHYSDEAKVVLM